MSSAKRRKVNEDIPSGLLESKAGKVSKLASTSASSSPELQSTKAAENVAEEDQLTKSFKDLVRKPFQ